jgi:hypothetical protein
MGDDGGVDVTQPPENSRKVDPVAAMRLLASASHGRVVFTLNALPAIRPVNHLVDDGQIIIRTRLTTAISTALRLRSSGELVVAYEADSFDEETKTGWSVVVTGRARTVTDPERVSRYEQLLHPWVNHASEVVAIDPDIVTGYFVTGNQT